MVAFFFFCGMQVPHHFHFFVVLSSIFLLLDFPLTSSSSLPKISRPKDSKRQDGSRAKTIELFSSLEEEQEDGHEVSAGNRRRPTQNESTNAVFYSRQRSSGCKCGKKPFADNLFPIVNFQYKHHFESDSDVDSDLVQPLIVGGSAADLYEFPWMVAIADISIPRQKIGCGGVLINSHFVLTAAHCVYHKFLWWTEIWFNAHDMDQVRTDENVLRRKVKRFILHPKYPQFSREHDIALIELKEPIDFTRSSIRPICLPTSDLNDFAGEMGVVAGWGYNSSFSGVRTSSLHKVTVPILSHQECRKSGHGKAVHPTMLCAGDVKNGGKDACYSDSGGPLIVEYGNRNVCVGLVAWGRGCGRKGFPGVYTRVSSYLKWITTEARTGEWCHRLNNKFLQRFHKH